MAQDRRSLKRPSEPGLSGARPTKAKVEKGCAATDVVSGDWIYDELKADGKNPGEEALNQLGYRMLRGKTADAIKVFSKNAREYPQSANVYDSLGDAYAAAGENKTAMENYKKALKIDPANEKASEQLRKLGRQF